MSFFPDSDVREAGVSAVPTGSTAPDDVLARVKAEGLRRRTRRHRRNGVLAVFGLALVAVPALALLPGDDDGAEDVTVAASTTQQRPTPTTNRRPTRTTVAPVPTTAAPVVTTIVVDGDEVGLIPPTVIERPPRTTVPPTTAPAPTCRNSMDSACGEFRWDPQPAPNQSLNASFVDVPATIAAGTPVTFTVEWSDGDAQLAYSDFAVDDEPLLGQACTADVRYGPWTPPDPAAGSGRVSETITLPAGDHRITAQLGTGDCNNPYASESTVQIFVTVS